MGWIQQDPQKLLSLLPKTVDPVRYLRICVSQVAGNEDIQNCTPESVFSSIMTAAQMGLAPGAPGQGWLIPFKEKGVLQCRFMPGYQGLCSFLIGNGKIASVSAEIVRRNDILRGSNKEGIVHEWAPAQTRIQRGAITAAYATIKYREPHVQDDTVLMSLEQLHDVRAKSQSYRAQRGPWCGSETDVEEMMKKTCILRAAKTLDFSMEDKGAIHEVMRADSIMLEAEYSVQEDAIPNEPIPGSAALADRLEDQHGVPASQQEPQKFEDPPLGYWRCGQCKNLFPDDARFATTGRKKICTGCSGQDEV